MNKEHHYNHLLKTGQLKGVSYWKKQKMQWEAIKEMSWRKKALIYTPGSLIAIIGIAVAIAIRK